MKIQKILLLISLVTIIIATHAQPNNNRLEKINSQKVAFITQEMNLSVAEAQQFWPLYNEMTKELASIQKQQQQLTRIALSKAKQLGDEEVLEMINKHLTFNEQEASIKTKYYKEFAKVLTAQKLLAFYIAEKKFKTQLLKRLKQDKE